MARYSEIDNSIWEELQDYSKDSRLLYIFSFSNSAVRDSGLYTISTGSILLGTGLTDKGFKSCLEELYPKLAYDFERKIMFVAGKLKRRLSGLKSNSNMIKAIQHDLSVFCDSSVTPLFIKKYEGALREVGISPPLPLPIPLPLSSSSKDLIINKGENPEKRTNEVAEREKWFDEIWQKYPVKDGKKHAKRHFFASVKTAEDYARISSALEVYLGSNRVKEGFIKNASTWFNGWEDWFNYQEPQKAETDAEKADRIIAQMKAGKYAKSV